MSRSVYRREGGWRLRWALLVHGDLLAACLAYLLAFLLRAAVPFPLTRGYLPALRFAEVHHHWIAMLGAQAGVLYFLGLYEPRALITPRAQAGPIAAAAGLQALILIAVYFFAQDLVFPRSIFIVFAGLNTALLFLWRLGSRSLMGAYPRRRVLVVGTNAAAAEVIDTIRVQQWLAMDIVGAVSADGTAAPAPRGLPGAGGRGGPPARSARRAARAARRAGARGARGAARALRAARRRRGDHRLRALVAGPAPRLAQPARRPARARLRRAVAVRDPDRTTGAPAAARHPADRGDPRAGRRGSERRQAALRRRPGAGAAPRRAAADAPRGAGHQADVARPGPLHPDPRRQGRSPVHDGQVPDDARGRRARHRGGARGRERCARHLARPLPARAPAPRAGAALERGRRA